jgi:CheY-like chemotaxis protein
MKTQGAGHILLADDDENDRYFFGLALDFAGVSNSIVNFADGQELMDYLKKAAAPLPNLLVLDLKMPRADGFTVLAWMRTQPHLRGLPVVVLSASELESDIRKAFELGAAEYRVKALQHSKLVTLVAELRERWLTTNKTPDATARRGDRA